MGLDQYLYKKTYIGNKYKEENKRLTVKDPEGKTDIKTERISEISEYVAYWRKCNQIHQFFVNNVQEGEDDCKEYYVSRDQLQTLVDTCKLVLKDRNSATELLPCQGGFFFGSTDYDEFYFSDLEETIKMIEPLIKEETGDFYYNASW